PCVKLMHDQGWISETPSFLYETTWLVALLTSILFVYLYRIDNRTLFVQVYLLSMVIKLIAYLGYNVWVMLEDRAGAEANTVFFLVTYGLFTVLEIAFLHRKISPSTRP